MMTLGHHLCHPLRFLLVPATDLNSVRVRSHTLYGDVGEVHAVPSPMLSVVPFVIFFK